MSPQPALRAAGVWLQATVYRPMQSAILLMPRVQFAVNAHEETVGERAGV